MKEYAVVNEAAEALAERFLPGALTLVMQATALMPVSVTLNEAVGIRIPDDPFCLALARAFGRPFTATSANKSGRETPVSVHEVIAQFGHQAHEIHLAIDAGEKKGKQASTVVTTVSGTPHLLREGAISRETLGL